MTTIEFDRTREKLIALRQQGMSVEHYLLHGNLFGPELNDEQIELLKELDSRDRRDRNNSEQFSLSF